MLYPTTHSAPAGSDDDSEGESEEDGWWWAGWEESEEQAPREQAQEDVAMLEAAQVPDGDDVFESLFESERTGRPRMRRKEAFVVA